MMNELKCPHCGKTFKVDESEYASIVSQVHSKEFEKEVQQRIDSLKRELEAKQQASEAEAKQLHQEALSSKDVEITLLKQQLEDTSRQQLAKVELAVAEKEKELNGLINAEKEERQRIQSQLEASELDKRMAVMEAERKLREEMQVAKDKAREELLQEKDLARQELQEQKDKVKELEQSAELKKQEVMLHEQELLRQHQKELDMKDEVIAQYKDFKTSLSTKMIGESLEVYCHNQYDTMVRPYMPDAYFDKDNDVVDKTKGDFVFRDIVDGVESVSIMFEMKNEADATVNKHKNSDFFDKLDKDRNNKKCEYAVLVTMLELDNDVYNNGIYVVPNKEKMYVVRPQQFLAIISLLVQMGRNSVKVKKELEDARNRDIDVTDFEAKVAKAKDLFGGHIKDAANRYNDALKDIDKAIEQLTNMKEHLRLWVDHLYKADGNLDDLTVRKLTSKNPTMKQKFDEARKAAEAQFEEVKS